MNDRYGNKIVINTKIVFILNGNLMHGHIDRLLENGAVVRLGWHLDCQSFGDTIYIPFQDMVAI